MKLRGVALIALILGGTLGCLKAASPSLTPQQPSDVAAPPSRNVRHLHD